MTLVLRFEELSTGQVKNGRKARWERAWQMGQGPHHAGLDRHSKEFKFCSMFSRKPSKCFK